ncbi:hypothetical protein AMK06_CH03367 [Rhizobium sp. N541]|uniref:hypothetical protein n=1 Tax=unclassified Rhizobium TaxID=2613769 RepID=UPI0007EE2D96|nr:MULTISPECIES: hypothetical protein [unclassified Rhizobium]ANM18241.1 hypothetical protein AMK06_CH03367 [Rhizobium sp. N541]ANM24627.1 hypothetical protein AMK07_CH03365 [Rhizobium sp. N941]
MLVYANSFNLNPEGGRNAVVERIATWVGQTRSSYVDPVRLGGGIRELKFADGAVLSSRATVDHDSNPQYPFYFCAKLTHGQDGVPGRRWITEIGLKQDAQDAPVQCSVLLETSEVSAKVVAPIHVTRPRIVQSLIENCKPVGDTPSLSVISLTETNAVGFTYSIEHRSRRYPVVLISANRDGVFPIVPERMRSLAVGLAQVVEIPPSADTFKIQAILGRRYIAFGGAINIIFPPRSSSEGLFCKTVLFRPDQLEELASVGTIEAEVMATITHYTNLPHSWRHTSSDMVGQAILAKRLEKAISEAASSDDVSIYEHLLQEAAENLTSKDEQIRSLREELEDVTASLEYAEAQTDALKHALSGVQSRATVSSDQIAEAVTPLRDALRSVLNESPNLEQGIRLLGGVYSDRVIVLESAIAAARESDRGGFRYGYKAFELLRTLAEDYWEALTNGKGDQQARAAFGNAFAAKEADTLSKSGREYRTFNYMGRDILMEKHLKIGVKDSFAETIRVHFEWFPDEQKIVIGHCGKHLDF